MDMAVDVASPLELIRHVASGNLSFTVDYLGGANSLSKNSVNFLLPSVLDFFSFEAFHILTIIDQ